jgi:hypothetical protein
MTPQIAILIRKSTMSMLRVGLLSSLAAAAPLFAASGAATSDSDHDRAPAKLVQIVREATERYIDVNAATAAGYLPAFGCVTGPDMGAMGVHYINSTLVGSGKIDATQPQALIYEPSGDRMRLVGVEYITFSAPWLAAHNQTPPILEGQMFQFIGSPNRYNLPALFELHVWAWRDNPHGAFVDWNTHVSCEKQ